MNGTKYWLSFCLFFSLGLGLVDYFTAQRLKGMPPRPDLPAFDRAFVSEYSPTDTTSAHAIIGHRLFGIDRFIRRADLFLLGSSHTQYGLSAAQLSSLLSQDGHKIRTFNLSLGCGEGAAYELRILEHAGISKRSAIADAYPLDGRISSCGRKSSDFDDFQAYSAVFVNWAKYLYDWSFDPILARVRISEQGVEAQRFIYGWLVERDWRTGDLTLLWNSSMGPVTPGTQTPRINLVDAMTKNDINWQFNADQIEISPELRNLTKALDIKLAVTLVPSALFPGEDPAESVKAFLAHMRLAPSPETRCFVPLIADGLKSWDGGHHLDGPGRALTTDRLAEGLKHEGCLQDLLGSVSH